jgi:aminopeptidase N
MWLHESFTTYLESVFVEEKYGYATMLQYINHFGENVANDQPMRGPEGVNFEEHGTDIYYKGALMLNTLRHCIGNDTLWWGLFRDFHLRHRLGHATGADFAEIVRERAGQDYGPFFEQYLDRPQIPVLEYRFARKGRQRTVEMRWTDVPDNFSMPIETGAPGRWQRTTVKAGQWTAVPLSCPVADFRVATDKWFVETRLTK